eukprot:scaffold2563_cov124-Cylindrotheca_fusiformis.AAC.12
MKTPVLTLSLLWLCPDIYAGSSYLKGSHRRMEKFHNAARNLGVGNVDRGGKGVKDGKHGGRKKGDDEKGGSEEYSGDEEKYSEDVADSLRPNSNPVGAPSAVPVPIPSAPTRSPIPSESSPSGAAPTAPGSNPATPTTSMPDSSEMTSIPTSSPVVTSPGEASPVATSPAMASPVTAPSAEASSPTLSPAAMPVSAPQVGVPTSTPTTTATTISPTMSSLAPTTVNPTADSKVISRTLFPFEITLAGSGDQFKQVNEPLRLTLEFFFESKLGEIFEPLRSVRLQEIAVDNVQRQMIRRGFGFDGQADFNDNDPPSSEEVHKAQQVALDDYIFELSELLKENGILLHVVDVTFDSDIDTDDKTVVDDDDGSVDRVTGDGTDKANSDDNNSTIIWATLVLSALVLSIGFFLIRRRRRSDTEGDGLLLEEPDDSLMVDTGEPKLMASDDIVRLSAGDREEFEETQPRPETEFLNVPTVERNEVVQLRSVTQFSENPPALLVDTFHNNDQRFSRPASPNDDPANCAVA